MKTNPLGLGRSATEYIGMTYPGSASTVNFPELKPTGRPRSTSISPKNVDVFEVVEDPPLPPDPPVVVFPAPPEWIGEVMPIVVPSEVVVSVSDPNKRLA